MPEEFHLQQQLLATPLADDDHVDEVIPVAFALLARPQALLEDAVAPGVLGAGRVLRPHGVLGRRGQRRARSWKASSTPGPASSTPGCWPTA